MVKGESVYSKLKYESGAHRVQRVPATESQGRVHTSTATVLVMPEADDFDFQLDESEVRIDITRSSGCGGICRCGGNGFDGFAATSSEERQHQHDCQQKGDMLFGHTVPTFTK